MSIFARFGKNWTCFGLFSTLNIFIRYYYGGIDTSIKFLSPSCKNFCVFWNLVARQPHEKSKIGHNLLYIGDRNIILGSIPPFSTMAKLIITSEYKFNNHLTCKLPIYNFSYVFHSCILGSKVAKINIFGIFWPNIDISSHTTWQYAHFKTKLFLEIIFCEDPPCGLNIFYLNIAPKIWSICYNLLNF